MNIDPTHSRTALFEWSKEDIGGGLANYTFTWTEQSGVGPSGWPYMYHITYYYLEGGGIQAPPGNRLPAYASGTGTEVLTSLPNTFDEINVRFWCALGTSGKESEQGQFPIEAGPPPCEDIDITEIVTNNTGQVREYYWTSNSGQGWVPAQTAEGEFYGTFTVQPGQSIEVNFTLDAADNIDCSDFALQSCALFAGEIQDPNCGTVEIEIEQPMNEYPPAGGPTGGGGSGEPPEYREGGGLPNPYGERGIDDWTTTSDNATSAGQEEIIKAQQDLARFQSGEDYRNTQDIIAAIDNIEIEEISEEIHIDPSESPDDTLNTSEEITGAGNILTDTDSILDTVSTGLPTAPIIPTSIGTSTIITLDWGGYKGLAATLIHLDDFDTQIQFFRQVTEWFLYILIFFVVLKITRSAFAG